MTPPVATAGAPAEPGLPPARGFPFKAYLARSRAVDLSGIAWDDVPRHQVTPETVRTLRYMQDIESHTIVYLRSLLATRAIDDPEVAAFLACWIYEETFHGLALARFLEAARAPRSASGRGRGDRSGSPSGWRPGPRRSCPARGRTSARCT